MIPTQKIIARRIIVTTSITRLETHIKFVDGTEGDYLIEGDIDIPALIDCGLMLPEGNQWLKSPREISIGSLVTNIGTYTFNDCLDLVAVTIPNSVTHLGGYTFEDCISLTNVSIPDSVTSIEEQLFVNCHGLVNVAIPDSITSIGNVYINLSHITFIAKDDALE